MIADGSEEFSHALKKAVEQNADWEVVGMASDGMEAVMWFCWI